MTLVRLPTIFEEKKKMKKKREKKDRKNEQSMSSLRLHYKSSTESIFTREKLRRLHFRLRRADVSDLARFCKEYRRATKGRGKCWSWGRARSELFRINLQKAVVTTVWVIIHIYTHINIIRIHVYNRNSDNTYCITTSGVRFDRRFLAGLRIAHRLIGPFVRGKKKRTCSYRRRSSYQS